MVHVLLLEDSTHIHRVVNLILGNSPHVKVEIASTPQQAHATLGYLQPDLIICSGQFFGPQTAQMLNQICSTVQMSHPNCSVLVLLGSGDKPEYFRNEGIDHLIKKPFTSEDLGEAVGKILGLNPLKSETHEAPPSNPKLMRLPPLYHSTHLHRPLILTIWISDYRGVLVGIWMKTLHSQLVIEATNQW